MAMSTRKTAIVHAFTVEIACPHCGEPQPSTDGSHFWTIQELHAAAERKQDCNACDEPLTIRVNNTARIGACS